MNMEQELLTRIDELEPLITSISREIHAHPEQGYREFRAVRLLTAELERQGFTVEKPLEAVPTAFRASFRGKSQKPALGFLAEYDALPEIGHGCGHNLIAASAFGAAVSLAPFAERSGGSVWLFGTPAEEYDGGKIPMLEAGLFDILDAALMMHPECIYLVNTMALAMDAFQFTFRGKAAHAAATPHEGVNALDAVILLFNAIGALRQQLTPDVRIHGIITKGGTYPNIIPHLTEARFYLRARERRCLDEVASKVRNCARGAAKATGCSMKMKKFERSNDNLVNNPVMAEILAGQLARLGVTELAEEDMEPGSTDFGNVSHRVPSVYFYAATAEAGTALHTREFTRCAISERAHRHTMQAVRAMALTGLEILQNPHKAEEIRQAFTQSQVSRGR